MIVYKHIDKQFADDFEQGRSIRVGSLAYYRKMEGDRADPWDGSVWGEHDVLTDRDARMAENGDEEMRKIFRRLGINPANIGTNTVIRNNIYALDLPNIHVFCASSKIDKKFIDEGDVVFKISFRAFLNVLTKSAGLTRPAMRRVEYARIKHNLSKEEFVTPNAFYKDPNLKWENEIRGAWINDPMSDDVEFKDIYCPDAREFIQRVVG